MIKTITLTVNRFMVGHAIRTLNRRVDGKNVRGIFYTPTSLFRGTLQINISEPEIIQIEKVVEVEKIVEVPLKVINQVKKQNRSSSQYRGVYKKGSKWHAMIQHDGKKLWLGSFFHELDAAEAYDKKAIELKGELATLNFPDKNE